MKQKSLLTCLCVGRSGENLHSRVKLTGSKNSLLSDEVAVRPVWPDWAIFKAIGNKLSCKSSPNNSWLFGLLHYLLWLFMGNHCKIWATFYSNIWSHWLWPTGWTQYTVSEDKCKNLLWFSEQISFEKFLINSIKTPCRDVLPLIFGGLIVIFEMEISRFQIHWSETLTRDVLHFNKF